MNKAIFIDKDGTLIENVPFNVNPSMIRISDQSIKGLRLLQARGYKIIVVSNQSGVAKGYFKESDLLPVKKKLIELLEGAGIAMHGFYYCPHHPDGSVEAYAVACNCRKPRDGMFRRAAADHQLDMSLSWMVGDILDDIEAGNSAGCRSILINNQNETEWQLSSKRTPFAIVRSINEAASVIIEHQYELVD